MVSVTPLMVCDLYQPQCNLLVTPPPIQPYPSTPLPPSPCSLPG